MITIHQLCYNEALILEFAFNFYKSRFPNAKFILHDNQSTDGSLELAKRLGYEIHQFSTNNQMDDSYLLNLRESCWKNDETDWVLVADMDELININQNDLILEEQLGSSVILTYGFQMVNLSQNIDLDATNYGFRDDALYDKSLIFNKKSISNMNWSVGSHSCNPSGTVQFSVNRYNLLHFKYLSEDYIVNRYKELRERQSQINVNNLWSVHYNILEEQLRQKFRDFKNKALIKLL